MREKTQIPPTIPNFQSINLLPWKKSIFIFCFLIVTTTVFIYRIPGRYFSNRTDFIVLYLASSAFMQGGNPYDHDVLANICSHNCGPIAEAPKKDDLPSLYPLSTYIIISPLTLLKYNDAKRLLFGLNCLAIGVLFLVTLKLAKLHYLDWRSILLLSIFIGLAPIQNVVFQGQLVLLAILFVLCSIWSYTLNLNFLSGVLLALGLCLKPHLAIFFFMYHIIVGNFMIYVSCTITCFITFLIGIIRLGLNDFSWIVSWQENLKYANEITNSPYIDNNTQHNLLNLQYPLSAAFESHVFINIIVLTILLVAFILFIKYIDKSNNNYNILINMSFISTITLLPFYHRNYDASLLLLPVTIGVLLLNTQYDKIGKSALILMAPFLAPSASMTYEFANYYGLVYNNGFLLNFILIPHQVWILLTLSGLFIYLMFRKKNQGLPSWKIY